MKTLAQRLKHARLFRGLTQKALGELVGISQAAIQKIETEKATQTTKLIELSDALGVRPEWLGSGNGSMLPSGKTDSIPPETEWGTVETWDARTPINDDEVEVPFYKDIEFACGAGRIGDEDYNGYKLRFSKSTLRRIGASTDGHSIICFPARGNSMEPNIPDGTTVAVNTEDKKIVDGKLYAINEDGWKRIKLLYRTGPETISVRSYNTIEHPPEEKPLNKIEVIGRVFWWSVLDY